VWLVLFNDITLYSLNATDTLVDFDGYASVLF